MKRKQVPLWLTVVDGGGECPGSEDGEYGVGPNTARQARTRLERGETALQVARVFERVGVRDPYGRRWTPKILEELIATYPGRDEDAEKVEAVR